MRAFIINEPYKSVIGEWEKPMPEPDEVLVEVRAGGICAGDMYAYTGKNPYAVYPAICGHEIAGVITEVGDEVGGWEPGQRVVVEPFIGCGHCYPCRVGKSNCCANLTDHRRAYPRRLRRIRESARQSHPQNARMV